MSRWFNRSLLLGIYCYTHRDKWREEGKPGKEDTDSILRFDEGSVSGGEREKKKTPMKWWRELFFLFLTKNSEPPASKSDSSHLPSDTTITTTWLSEEMKKGLKATKGNSQTVTLFRKRGQNWNLSWNCGRKQEKHTLRVYLNCLNLRSGTVSKNLKST